MRKSWYGSFMKKTQIIELFKNIQGSLVSFVSMMMFIALGLAIFSGITFSVNTLKNAATNVQMEAPFHDLELYYPYGIDEDNLNTLKETEGVDRIEGIYSTSVLAAYNGNSKIVKFQTIPEIIDTIYELEGEMPLKADEIVIDSVSASANKIKIGDTITIIDDDASIEAYLDALSGYSEEEGLETFKDLENQSYTHLRNKTFKITGIVKTPVFNSKSGNTLGVSVTHKQANDMIAYTIDDSFNMPEYRPYNYVYICNDSLRQYPNFSEEYSQAVTEFSKYLEADALAVANDVYKSLDDSRNTIITSGEEKLSDGKNQIEEGEKKLEEGARQIEDGEYLISANQKKLNSGKVLLDEAREKLEDAQSQVDNAEIELRARENELNYYVDRINNYDSTRERARQALRSALDNAAAGQEETALWEVIQNNEDFKIVMMVNLAPLLKDDVSLVDLANNTLTVDILNFKNELSSFIQNTNLNEAQKTELTNNASDFVVHLLKAAAYKILDNNEKFIEHIFNGAGDLLAINNVIKDLPGYDSSVEAFRKLYAKFGELADISRAADTVTDIININFDYDAYKTSALNRVNDLIRPLQNQISEAWDKLDDAQIKINDGYAQYEEKYAEYEKGVALIAQGKKQIANYKIQLEEGKIQLADAKLQYEEGVKSLEEFKNVSNSLKNYGVSISTREDNQSYTINMTTFDSMNKLKFSLGSLFIIIGTLVCYSVISRLVNDQIIRIGTKKAIGLYQREILLSYLSYTGLALIIGLMFGCLVAFGVVEQILIGNLRSLMLAPVKSFYFSFKDVLPVFVIQLVIMEGATYMACSSMVKRNVTELLQGPKTSFGKRRFYESFKLWDRLSLLSKTIVNNFVNDKRRVFATIVGIAGCTALIVSSLTFRNNVLKSIDLQFERYYHFDSFVTFSDESTMKEIEKVLDKHKLEYIETNRTLTKIKTDNDISAIIYLYVYDGDLNKVMTVETAGKNNPYTGDGVWVGESIQHFYKLDNQTDFAVTTTSGVSFDVTTAGFNKNHTQNNFMIMDAQTYEMLSGEEFAANCLTLNLNGLDREVLKDELKNIDGFLSLSNYKTSASNLFNVFKLMANVMVAVYIGLSFLMAVFVIYNLLSMYIAEKKKELIVLMINGFSLKQARRYIYSDTILLTVIGVILGCLLGYVIGDYSITSLENSYIRFVHEIDWISILVGVVFTSIMTFAVSVVSLKKIEKFKLTELPK